MEDEDFLLALQLQEQFNYEASASTSNDDNYSPVQSSKKRKVESSSDVIPYSRSTVSPERPMSIVDESWETIDPSPDVRAMFLEFNDKFFWGKLFGVEVRWSPRMTLCAGLCAYEGRGGLCSIRLSEPILKLRPRRDLVETLLHEMIHALLFVTQNNRDRDGHGPEFCKHMGRINEATGTNITVYHSFHDEVDLYRQHWWRCDGPCKDRKPFFGYVKRAMNRAPSARDPWWPEHQRTCGGTYTKIKEPEGYGQKKGKTDDQKDKAAPKKSIDKSKLPSTTTASGSQDIRNLIPFSGKGFVLGGSSQPSSSQKPPSRTQASPETRHPKPRISPPGQAAPKEVNWEQSQSSSRSSSNKTASTSTVSISGKKSVSNTKAFVNINGSPVRISKTNGQLTRPFSNLSNFSGNKQRSVYDLFQTKGLNSPEKTASATSTSRPTTETKTSSIDLKSGTALGGGTNSRTFGQPTKGASSSNSRQIDSHHSSDTGGAKSGSVEPRYSKYFGSPQKSGASVPASRKRGRDNRIAAHIFDFFQQTTSESSTSRDSGEDIAATATPPAVQQLPGSSSHSANLTISCPVCQAKVPESKINEHLDSCLT